MDFRPAFAGTWGGLQDAWLALPRHRHILTALEGDPGRLVLRYAAIDWRRPRLGVDDERNVRLAATWLQQLIDVYRLLESTGPGVAKLFLNPIVKIDTRQSVRVAFAPGLPKSGPPELFETKPSFDERALVHVVGNAFRQVVIAGWSARLLSLSQTCTAEKPSSRFKSLAALAKAVNDLIGEAQLESDEDARAWEALETGMGWLELGQIEVARRAIDTAAKRPPLYELAMDAMNIVRDETAFVRPTTIETKVAEPPGPDRSMISARLTSAGGVDWAAAASWRKRDVGFEELQAFDDGRLIVAMTYSPLANSAEWKRLQSSWLGLEQPSAILEAVAAHGYKLLLRYAALNWKLPPMQVDRPGEIATAATWLIDLADTYQMLSEVVPADLPLFANPVVHIDLDRRPRLAFTPKPLGIDELAPELRGGAAMWDQRTLVFHVGTLMKRIVSLTSDGPIRDLILSCCEARPWKRWKTLAEVISAVETLGVDVAELRARRRATGWVAFEEGLGWLELGQHQRALEEFELAETALGYGEMGAWGRDVVRSKLEDSSARLSVARAGEIVVRRRGVVHGQGRRERKYAGPPADVSVLEHPAVLAERVREAMSAGDMQHAGWMAEDSHRRHPGDLPLTRLLVEIELRRGHAAEAMKLIEPMMQAEPDAALEYLRGKSLFMLGRLHEARESFERAFAADPKLLEAFLLRREVDRAIGATRRLAGEAAARQPAIPEALAELRDVLLSGDAKAAIKALGDERFARDPDALLVLARFLAMDSDIETALATYDRIAALPEQRFVGLLGKADMLLESGRVASALALFDELCADKPSDADASEGRARALEKLGRLGEAAAEYRRFIALATAGSDLRVRAAQLWLEDHPL